MNPTTELYSSILALYDHFNQGLFEGKLPQVIITSQRINSVMGYFSPDQWTSKEGARCHEIAINPAYVGSSSVIELLQTLVHEMTHCWQFCYGTPGRRGYHNKEWAAKMLDIGLVPSNTGRPGGKTTGEKMSDYPAKSGKFIDQCKVLIGDQQFTIPWVDRFPHSSTLIHHETGYEYLDTLEGLDDTVIEQLTSTVAAPGELDATDIEKIEGKKKKLKSRYRCGQCNLSLWGKPGLNVACIDCDQVLCES